jgi:tagatose-6-phosphate ketose/aldose isomerase
MNAFAQLRPADDAKARANGTEHTVREILQQPGSWRRMATGIVADAELARFLAEAGEGPIVLMGAGSSAYVGDALAPSLGALTGRPVMALPTTDVVTHPEDLLPPGKGLCVSFARSGSSPESVAAVERVRQCRPGYRHLFITCNREGALVRMAAAPWAHALCMPAETNDVSLVMTSSFTAMYLAGLAIGAQGRLAEWQAEVEAAATRTAAFIERCAGTVVMQKPHERSRIQYLGSGPHAGAAREMSLKMIEMNDGRIAVRWETFVGLRHGPQVFVRPDTLVVAVLSGSAQVRAYELDMLRELHAKGQGRAPLVLAPAGVAAADLPADAILLRLADQDAAATALSQRCPDAFLVPTALCGGQMLATVGSLGNGLKPDAPSAGGTISRVVQGVVIHTYQKATA